MTNRDRGQLMRKWRLAAGETIAKVAKEFGYAAAYLSQMENGRKNVGDNIFNAYRSRYDNYKGIKSILDDHEKHIEANKILSSIGPVDIKPYVISNLDGHEPVKTNKIDKIYEAVMESQKKMDEMHALLKSIFE